MPTEIKRKNDFVFWKELHKKTCLKRVPFNINYELTYNCNLSCKHCYVVKDKKRQDLKYEEIISVIDQLSEMGALSITFTGGEVFSRPDFIEILEYTKNRGFFIEIMTNATLIDSKIAASLRKISPVMVYVSLYGITNDIYNKVTGKDELTNCLSGIKLLQERDVPLKINAMVTKDNLCEIPQIEKYAQNAGADFQADPYIHPALDNDPGPLKYRVSGPEYINNTKSSTNRKDLSKCNNNEPFKMPGEAEETRSRFFPCDVGRNSMVIDPSGYVYLCQTLPYPRFDSMERGLLYAWQELHEYRDSLKPGSDFECPDCDLSDYCDWCPGCGLLETGDMNRCVPFLKETALLNRIADENS